MKKKIVKLDRLKVTINEMRLRNVVEVLANIEDILGKGDLSISDLVTEKFDLVKDLLKDVVTIEGGEIDDLTFSEIDSLIPVFKEVNESFLDKLALMGLGLKDALPIETLEET